MFISHVQQRANITCVYPGWLCTNASSCSTGMNQCFCFGSTEDSSTQKQDYKTKRQQGAKPGGNVPISALPPPPHPHHHPQRSHSEQYAHREKVRQQEIRRENHTPPPEYICDRVHHRLHPHCHLHRQDYRHQNELQRQHPAPLKSTRTNDGKQSI